MYHRVTLPLLSLVCLTCTSAHADSWHFKIEPYLMATNINGDSTIGTVSAPLDVDFDTILNNLDGALMLRFEAFHESNWGVMADWAYMDLGKSLSSPQGGVADARVRQGVFELSLAHQFYSPSLGHWTNYVGLRRWDNTYQFSLDPALIPSVSVVDRDEDWLDVIVGYKYDMPISANWQFSSAGDVGGFGLSAKFTGSLKLGVTYQLSEHWKTALLYKGTYVDYQTNGETDADLFEYKTITHGPLLSMSYEF